MGRRQTPGYMDNRKTIQKAIEGHQIPQERKAYLKTLR